MNPRRTSSLVAVSVSTRIGHEVLWVRMDFELEPVGLQSLARQLGRQDGFATVAHTRRVGQQTVALGFQIAKQIVGGTIGAYAAEGHGHQRGARGRQAFSHERCRSELAGAHNKREPSSTPAMTREVVMRDLFRKHEEPPRAGFRSEGSQRPRRDRAPAKPRPTRQQHRSQAGDTARDAPT
jgi:hypothetical protein